MRSPIVFAVLMTLTLAACAQTPKGGPSSRAKPAPVAPVEAGPMATPGLTTHQRQRKAVELLGVGQAAPARAELLAILAEHPSHAVARKLLDQIDRDPRELLGQQNYAYTVRRGDSMSALAERLMGDSLLFYGLARYNNVADPSQMAAGQTLLIPGVQRRAAPARAAAAPSAADAPPAVRRNPAAASRLRGQALEQMNRGAIDRAVGLLSQALALDPENTVIQRDLDRAERIQANVRGR